MNDKMGDKMRKSAGKPKGNFLTRGFGDLLDYYKGEFISLLRKELSEALLRNNSAIAELVRSEAQRILDGVWGIEVDRQRNINLAGHRIAIRETAEFVLQHMPKTPTFPHPHALLQHALSLAPTGGLALEFGVFTGTTLRIIAEARKACGPVYGFDSFEGLPEAWRSGLPKGAFAIEQLPQVDDAELVVGWFDNSLPDFLKKHQGVVDFLHIDCDIYSSTKTVLELVGPRLRPGSVVLFDEFFNYPGWKEHEFKAWTEFLQSSGLRCSYDAYTHNNEQVMARIVE